MPPKPSKKQLLRLQGTTSSLSHVNAINRLCDAVDSMQAYLTDLHGVIKDLEAEVTKLKSASRR